MSGSRKRDTLGVMEFLENVKDLLPEWLSIKPNFDRAEEADRHIFHDVWADDADDLAMSNRMDLFHLHFRDVDDLVPVPKPLTVKGDFPHWLRGRFIRIGPGKFDLAEDFSLNHWFDGYALMYKLDIDDGSVTLTKKFLQSEAYKKALAHQRPVFTEFGTRAFPDPDKNIFARVMSKLNPSHMTDNDGANILNLFGRVYASSETCYMREVDPTNLETGEKLDFHKAVGINFMTSHHLVDGDVAYNIGTSVLPGLKHHVIKMENPGSEPLTKKASIMTSFSPRWRTAFSYFHSFGMSKKYIIFIEVPLLVHTTKLLMSQTNGYSLRECMDWCPEENNRFVLIDKETGAVIKTSFMTADPFFFFHIINAFEVGDELVIDLIGNDSTVIVDNFSLEKCRSNVFSPKDPGFLRRFVLPLKCFKELPAGQNLVKLEDSTATAYKIGHSVVLRPEVFGEQGYENPAINESRFMKPYRYFYATSHFYGGPFANSLIKVDLHRQSIKRWHINEQTYPTEPVFVPHPDAQEEDDGVLMTTVTVFNENLTHPDPEKRRQPRDFLVVLDARTMEEVARAELNTYLPMLLHGMWVPAAQADAILEP